jgi:hypothetical protein
VSKLDREELNTYKNIQQTRLFIQAYMDIDTTRYWSTIKQVNVEILDENDEFPLFKKPSDNQTQIEIKNNRFDSIYNFSAIDLDLNDRVTYMLIEQNLVYANSNETLVKLPFALNPRNGSLSFNQKNLSQQDFR